MNASLGAGRISRPWLVAFVLVVGAGMLLRLDQLSSQLLIEDEWHAVRHVVTDTPAAMFVDFGVSDYSIPLGLLYWFEAGHGGLSETGMRLPMLVAGIATLIVFPWYVARRVGSAEALLFALLLAISPLLFAYSRTARPYALTLLLIAIAHVSFRRYVDFVPRARWGALVYGGSGALAAWLHPIVAPFVFAPFVPALWHLARGAPGERRTEGFALVRLALCIAVPTAALLLPPLLAHPEALSAKGGLDLPDAATFAGVWFIWFGTASTLAVIVCAAFALAGAQIAWRRLPETRTLLAGAALMVLAIVVSRPAWVHNPLTFARYLLPVLPVLLLATACGAVVVQRRIAALGGSGSHGWSAIGVLAALLPVLALAATTPLLPLVQHPNSNTLHSVYQFDYRPEHNPVVTLMDGIPLSPWWATLASQPRDSLRIAAAPFPLNSGGWDAPRWEHESGQRVLQGFLNTLCANPRPVEVPDDPRFRFRNAVHLGDDADIAAHRVDFIAWVKPYVYAAHGLRIAIGDDVAPCGAALASHFGAPVFEDEWLAVYRPRSSRS